MDSNSATTTTTATATATAGATAYCYFTPEKKRNIDNTSSSGVARIHAAPMKKKQQQQQQLTMGGGEEEEVRKLLFPPLVLGVKMTHNGDGENKNNNNNVFRAKIVTCRAKKSRPKTSEFGFIPIRIPFPSFSPPLDKFNYL